MYNLTRMRGDTKFTFRQVRKAARLLGLGDSATLAEIKNAYRELARIHHPDMGGDGADSGKFLEVSFAYNVLLEYAKFYRIEFTEEAYLKRYPEEKLRRRFYADPIWGPGKSEPES